MANDGTLKFDTSIDADGFNAGLSKLANMAKTGLKTTAVALTSAATAIAGVTAAAVNNYAEYEQLVGGVETLFKSSSEAVQKYADNAYKTAGLSANEYMSTVTSFSASLLQSLDGDTEAAAEAANQAIIDMADNANKMGSSMESIQNAYQGFAKQNYTMLDNLKLGYGGTKEEMARLLEDATAISGIEYDMSSYADVVSAIHVIQTEMGITGTTAKEASETIQGSAAAMKGAWENFLTGMADPAQDFDALVGNLIDSVMVFADNLIPRIAETAPRLVEGLASLFEGLAPEVPAMLEPILQAVIEGASGITTAIKDAVTSGDLIDSGVNMATSIITGLSSVASDLATTGLALIANLEQGIAEGTPEIIPAIAEAITGITQAIITYLPDIIQSGIEIIMALVEGIASMLPTLATQAIELASTLVETLLANLPMLIETGISVLMAIVQGVIDTIPTLIQTITELIPQIITALTEAIPILLEGAIQLFTAILDALPIIIEQLLQALPGIITAIITFLVENIPVILDAAIQLLMAIIEAIPTIIQAIIDNLPMIITALIEGLVGAVPQLLEAAITLLMALIDAIPEIVVSLVEAIPQIITALVTGLVEAVPEIFTAAKDLLWQIIEAIPEIVTGLAEAIPDIITGIVNGLADGATAVWEGAKSLGSSIIDGFKDILGIHSPSAVMEEQGDFLTQGLLNGIADLPTKALEAIGGVLDSITQWGTELTTKGIEVATTFVDGIITLMTELPGKVWVWLVDTVTKIVQWGINIQTQAITAVQTMINNVVSAMTQLPGKVWTWLVNVVNNLVQWGVNIQTTAQTAIQTMITGIITLMQELPGKVMVWLTNVVNQVGTWGINLKNKAVSAVTTMVNGMVSILSGLPDKFVSVGSNIVTGIWNGINSGWNWLKDKVASLADSLLDAAKDALGIESPSKEFRDKVGKWLIPGITEGMDETLPEADADIRKAAGHLTTTMRDAVQDGRTEATAGTTARATYNAITNDNSNSSEVDNSFTQYNTYNCPVATPSEVNKAQRKAARELLKGGK